LPARNEDRGGGDRRVSEFSWENTSAIPAGKRKLEEGYLPVQASRTSSPPGCSSMNAVTSYTWRD
jgi:hypothetical protein